MATELHHAYRRPILSVCWAKPAAKTTNQKAKLKSGKHESEWWNVTSSKWANSSPAN